MNLSKNASENGVAERIAYSVDEAAAALGFGRSTLYREMSEGGLPYRKVGDRRLILRDDLMAWLVGPTREASDDGAA